MLTNQIPEEISRTDLIGVSRVDLKEIFRVNSDLTPSSIGREDGE